MQPGQPLNIVARTIRLIPDGNYDATVTAFEGGRRGSHPSLAVQFTIDNGPFAGHTALAHHVAWDGMPDEDWFKYLGHFCAETGFPPDGYVWYPDPERFARQFQERLAEKGRERYRASVAFSHEYVIDGQYRDEETKRRWTRQDYETSRRSKQATLRAHIDGSLAAPKAPPQIRPQPVLPADLMGFAPPPPEPESPPPPPDAGVPYDDLPF